MIVSKEFHLFGEAFGGGVDPKIWMALFGFIGDAVVHQDRNANALRLGKDTHQMLEDVKGKEAIKANHDRPEGGACRVLGVGCTKKKC